MSTRSNTIWTFAITSVALFMVTLDNLVVTTALPVIRKDLHASLSQLEWTVNAYTLTFAVLLLAATSALGIVWALIRANTLGWTSPEIAATLAAGIVLGAAFIGWELRVADPMVPLRLFRSRPIAAGNAATFSVSMAIPATMSAVMTAVPPAAIGQASGTLNTLRQLGGVFGVAICAAVFAARGHYASPATFVAGFGPAMAACAGLALLGAAAGLVIPGRRQAPPSAVAVQPVQNHAPKIEIRR